MPKIYPSAILVNTILEKILPWYKVQFLDIGSFDVALSISKVQMRAQLDTKGLPYLSLPYRVPQSQYNIDLINHLNGILSGKIRNDAGELVSTKAS